MDIQATIPIDGGKERLFAIERVHRCRQTVEQPALDGIGRPGNRGFNPGLFFRLEPGQHVVCQVSPCIPAADAYPQPRIIDRAELLGNRSQSIVSAFGAREAKVAWAFR